MTLLYLTDVHYGYGSQNPFLGYTTPTSSEVPSIHFIEKDVLVSKVKNLLDLVSWVNVTLTMPDGTVMASNATQLINKLLQAFTSATLDELTPFSAKKKSGTICII